MLDLTLRIDTTEGERELRLLADSLDEDSVDELLERYGEMWLRARIQAHIDQARPPKNDDKLAAKAAESAPARAAGSLRKKLEGDLRRAKKRLGRVEDADGFFRERERQQLLSAKGRRSRGMSQVIQSRMAAVARRAAVLGELERVTAGAEGPSQLNVKAQEKLQARYGRALQRAAQRKPLGKIAGSFKLTVKSGRLVYGSEISWSGVQNDGGTVGHGAVIQPNPFAYLEPIDIEVLVSALLSGGVGVIAR